MCSVTVMVMEAFSGLEYKYQYEIIGHSGDTPRLPLVPMGKPPRNTMERLQVIHEFMIFMITNGI